MAPWDSNGSGVMTPAPVAAPESRTMAGAAAQAAFAGYVLAQAALIAFVESGGLRGLSELEQVEFAQNAERSRNRMSLVDHAVIAEADRSGLAAGLG